MKLRNGLVESIILKKKKSWSGQMSQFPNSQTDFKDSASQLLRSTSGALLTKYIVDNLGVPLLHDSLRAIVEVVAVFCRSVCEVPCCPCTKWFFHFEHNNSVYFLTIFHQITPGLRIIHCWITSPFTYSPPSSNWSSLKQAEILGWCKLSMCLRAWLPHWSCEPCEGPSWVQPALEPPHPTASSISSSPPPPPPCYQPQPTFTSAAHLPYTP